MPYELLLTGNSSAYSRALAFIFYSNLLGSPKHRQSFSMNDRVKTIIVEWKVETIILTTENSVMVLFTQNESQAFHSKLMAEKKQPEMFMRTV